MQTLDWWLLLHPVLAVVLIYPLLGVVVRLGWQARQRRVHQAKLPATTGRDHNQLGQWLAAAVVVLVLGSACYWIYRASVTSKRGLLRRWPSCEPLRRLPAVYC